MNISVFGLGYVGCVSVGCLARNGHNGIGVDVNETKVRQINNGLPTIIEKDIDIIIQEERARNRIVATTDYVSAIEKTDVSIIAVGTPSGMKGHLNLSYIFQVANHFGQVMKEKKIGPGKTRKELEAMIDRGMPDRQIFDDLLKQRGPLMLQPHLLP